MYDCKRSEMSEINYEMDRGERIEMMVDIYGSSNSVRNHEHMINTERHQPLQHTGSVSVKNRRHRAVEVCLCLLCVLLLIAVIVIYVYFTTERKQLLTHNYNLTNEPENLLTKYSEIINQYRILIEEKTDTKHHINNLTKDLWTEKDQCLIKTRSLSEERDQLINERNELYRWLTELDQRSDNFKWTYYNFSFYYISSEYKSWNDSRRDCKQREADLVIINSRKEQEFLKKATSSYYYWIGLTINEGVWKWVDESTLTTSFWRSGYPRYYNNYCPLTSASGWTDYSCDYNYGWICEKRMK